MCVAWIQKYTIKNSTHRAFALIKPLVLVMCAMAMPSMAKQIMLGPPDPGAEHGFDYWYHGTNGGGYLSIDDTDPKSGTNDFTLGNKTVGAENRADWRSQNFTLGSAADEDFKSKPMRLSHLTTRLHRQMRPFQITD
jgi:hypothetical protein